MTVTLMSLALIAASAAYPGDRLVLEEGSVACRSKAALEAMRSAGGFERLPEFLIGTACFRLSAPLTGQVRSVGPGGGVEIVPRQRRLITQPSSLWVERPVEPNAG